MYAVCADACIKGCIRDVCGYIQDACNFVYTCIQVLKCVGINVYVPDIRGDQDLSSLTVSAYMCDVSM